MNIRENWIQYIYGLQDSICSDLEAADGHGWSDTGITPENSIWYYESVLSRMGNNQSDWLRLFMQSRLYRSSIWVCAFTNMFSRFPE